MKHISIFIVLVLLLALTACSRDPASPSRLTQVRSPAHLRRKSKNMPHYV